MPLNLTAELLLTWGGPPLIGAFIGYLTNDIAIRMLFRPLRPWRVFGLRVPLTPGVIPSKRHQLAENIGAMVGDQLLTSKDIGEAMSAEHFQERLRQIADEKLNALLAMEIGPLLNFVPPPFRVHAKIGLRTLKQRLRTGLLSYLGSPGFAQAAGRILDEQLRRVGDRRLDELLRAEDREALHAALEELGARLLTAPGAAAWLAGWLEESLTEAAAAGRSLGDFLPAELRELLCGFIADHAPQFLAQAAAAIAEPPLREKLAQAARRGVERFIDSLGPMAAMARGFISMEHLDAVIRAWLAEREGDLAAWLKQPEIEQRAAQAMRTQAEAFFAAPLAGLLARIEPERLRQHCQQAAAWLLASLAEGRLRQALAAMLRAQTEELLAQGQISLADLAGKLPAESRRRLRQEVGGRQRSIADSEAARRLTGKLINSLVDQLAARPANVLRELFPADLRGGIVDQMTLAVNRLLIREAPGLTESLRIRELVRNKVDSLDLIRLERLLLSIMEEQFKYINLFGALLGFLIGLINIALLRLL